MQRGGGDVRLFEHHRCDLDLTPAPGRFFLGSRHGSQLAIFPNATHMVPFDDASLFNATVERFFRTPFVKKDRIKDFLTSYESLMAALPKK